MEQSIRRVFRVESISSIYEHRPLVSTNRQFASLFGATEGLVKKMYIGALSQLTPHWTNPSQSGMAMIRSARDESQSVLMFMARGGTSVWLLGWPESNPRPQLLDSWHHLHLHQMLLFVTTPVQNIWKWLPVGLTRSATMVSSSSDLKRCSSKNLIVAETPLVHVALCWSSYLCKELA